MELSPDFSSFVITYHLLLDHCHVVHGIKGFNT